MCGDGCLEEISEETKKIEADKKNNQETGTNIPVTKEVAQSSGL